MKTKTMVYLERQQLKSLKAQASAQHISLAELVRRLVAKHLDEPITSPSVAAETYAKMVALGSSGDRDVAERHDAYLADAIKNEHAG
jgi:hypothetical protein